MYSVIYSTMENIEEARAIGRILVEQKLVACVTLLPGVESIDGMETLRKIRNVFSLQKQLKTTEKKQYKR